MKRLLATIALLASVVGAAAQVGPNAITLSTNRVPSALTNSVEGTAFDVVNQKSVAVVVSAYSTNDSAVIGTGGTITLHFQGSMDNVTYFDNGTNWDATISKTTTNATSSLTVFDTTAARYFKVTAIRNPCTNLVVFPTATYHYK